MDNQAQAQRELPRYGCHKEVYALKIKGLKPLPDGGLSILPEDDRYAEFVVDQQFVPKHDAARPAPGWYYVVYDDGYKSFSPAKAFEDGYHLLYS